MGSQEFANKVCGMEISFDTLKALQNSNKIGFPDDMYNFLLNARPCETYNDLIRIYKLQIRCINKNIGVEKNNYESNYHFIESIDYRMIEDKEKVFVDIEEILFYLYFHDTLEGVKKEYGKYFKFFSNDIVLMRNTKGEFYNSFKYLNKILETQPLAPIIQDTDFKNLWYIPSDISDEVLSEISNIK